jgi:glycosyltransferase involved in cell wall biosynthesis
VTAFSVVITTYNRADRLGRAVDAVLAQTFEDFELVIVDDGSADETSSVVAGIDDPRVRYVYQDNAGLPTARNTGVAQSSGRYVTFLDDDDAADSSWLEAFYDALGGEDGVATCGAAAVDEQGRVISTLLPQPLGAAYENYHGLFLSGTFALSRHGYLDIGGFAEGVRYCPNAEFALRILPYCRSVGWPVRVINEPLLRWELRASDDRPAATPEFVLNGMKYVLAHHRDRLARSPEELGGCLAMAGVAEARLGHYPEARRFFAQAARAEPRRPKHWLRLGLAFVPPLGDAVWKARRSRGEAGQTFAA